MTEVDERTVVSRSIRSMGCRSCRNVPAGPGTRLPPKSLQVRARGRKPAGTPSRLSALMPADAGSSRSSLLAKASARASVPFAVNEQKRLRGRGRCVAARQCCWFPPGASKASRSSSGELRMIRVSIVRRACFSGHARPADRRRQLPARGEHGVANLLGAEPTDRSLP